MFLPELNHISNYRYELNGFGGINRRETAEIGEFADAVNLSSDEYPLIVPRKRYDIGVFPKTVLMWHNNDRDMALIPAVDPDTVLHITDLMTETVGLADGNYKMIFNGAESTRCTIDAVEFVFEPGQVYRFKITDGEIDGYSLEWCPSRIIADGIVKTLPPDIHYFKNPVCANIGTSTVICDEINGMWVLEYDKDTDSYTYSKVQNKYTVTNEIGGTSAVPLISGGNFCHMRTRFTDNTMVAGIVASLNEEDLKNKIAEVEEKERKYANYLIAYGENPYVSCNWYRITSSGNLQAVDELHYEFCTLEGAMMFFVGDYVEIKMSAIWGKTPNFATELGKLSGMYEVVRISSNDDGVKYSLTVKGSVGDYGSMNAAIGVVSTTQRKGDTQIISNVYLSGTESESETNIPAMTIERKAPENVRFICSHMNRIWANNGNNEIMCCARGNPYVWYRYEGNALDSWATTIGGDGAFTGCINYGYPLFFKDNRMFRITGSRPANFGFDEYSMRGIKAGCHDSAVIVNDVLYYQSIDGIYAYNTSTPVCVSEKVWKNWQKGKGSRFRDKYYIAVTEDGECRLYCYDTRSGIWHLENMGGADIRYLYPGRYLDGYEEYMTVYADCDEENYTGYVMSTGEEYVYSKEDPVVWSFETTDLLADEPEQKYLKGIYINCRVYPEEENEIEISVQYNGDGEWSHLASIGPQRGESRSVWYKYPVAAKRCENLKIKAEGVGKAVIYSVILEFEKGSTKR